jgi:hypothetical protein
MALAMTLRRMKRTDLTAHGFRSTFRDWAAEATDFARDTVEMALAHAVENKVEAAYRRGDLLEQRRKLMEAWGSYATRPAAGSATRCSRPVPGLAVCEPTAKLDQLRGNK